MDKKIVAVINLSLEDEITKESLNDYIETEFGWLAASGMYLEGFTEVPADTSLQEIEDAIVQNRSEKIEEEYDEALQELA